MNMNWRWVLIGNDRVLAVAIGASIVLHGIALAVHFKLPERLLAKASEPRLEVVLVNAKTKERPSRADILAQANLDRGGNVDEARRSRSPLPVTNPRPPGHDLAEAQRRVQELEVQQQKLLAAAPEAQARVPAKSTPTHPAEEAAPKQAGRDLADLALA